MEPSTSRKRKSSASQHVFTFKEARKVSRQETKNVKSRKACSNKANNTTNYTEEIKRLLVRLGVEEDECRKYIAMSQRCNVGKQELNKNSLRTLFGDSDNNNAYYRNRYYDEMEEYGEHDGSTHKTSPVYSGGDLRAEFLKRIDTGHGPHVTPTTVSRKQSNVSCYRHVYFITLMVTTSSYSSNSTAKARRPDTVVLCLPPVAGSKHGTKTSDQERLAELMIMKIFFVVRFIYRTLQEVIEKKRLSVNDGKGFSISDSCLPVIIIQHTEQCNTITTLWYKLMKEKIRKGDSDYAKGLSLNYFCNIL